MATFPERRRKKKARKARPKNLCDIDVLDKQQKNATRTVGAMALLAKTATCVDPRRQQTLLNERYRWEMVIPLQDGILPASTETAAGTQVSYKLYLKSEAPRTNWVQWLEVKPSNIPGAGLGVFTLREFTRGQAIGWYYGTKKKKSVRQDVYIY